jgi:hypothetical protein
MKRERAYSFFKFFLNPTKVTRGTQKVTASVRNTSDVVVRNIILTMHSLNEKALSVVGSEKFIYALMPGQEASADFDVLAASDAQIYFSLSGFKNADVFFRIKSLTHNLRVKKTTLAVLLN